MTDMTSIRPPLAPIRDRAIAEAAATHAKDLRELQERQERARADMEANAILALRTLVGPIPDDAIESSPSWAEPDPYGGQTGAIDMVTEGLRFRYTKTRYTGHSPQTSLKLVYGIHDACGQEALSHDVKFLWQLGEAIEAGPHPEGCPRPEPEAAPPFALAREPRVVTGFEERLLDALAGLIHEKAG